MKWIEIITDGINDDIFAHLKYSPERIKEIESDLLWDYDTLLTDVWIYKNSLKLISTSNKLLLQQLKNEKLNLQKELNNLITDLHDYTGDRADLKKLLRFANKHLFNVQQLNL